MRGLITAAGMGTRSGLDGKLRKEMLPVYDIREGRLVLRPMIDVIIARFRAYKIAETGVVLDPGDEITLSYVKREYPETEIIYQREKRGFGHAVLCARDFIDGDRFVLNAGDGLLLDEKTASDAVKSPFRGNILTIRRVKNPENYGTVSIERQGAMLKITDLVEKSPNPLSDYAICAFYILNPDIFEYLEKDRSDNIELTPAIRQSLMNGMETIGKVVKHDDWVSVGRVDDYVRVLSETLGRSRGNVS